MAPPSDAPPSRPLNYVVPTAAAEWPKAAACDSMGLDGLCKVLKQVAVEVRAPPCLIQSAHPAIHTAPPCLRHSAHPAIDRAPTLPHTRRHPALDTAPTLP